MSTEQKDNYKSLMTTELMSSEESKASIEDSTETVRKLKHRVPSWWYTKGTQAIKFTAQQQHCPYLYLKVVLMVVKALIRVVSIGEEPEVDNLAMSSDGDGDNLSDTNDTYCQEEISQAQLAEEETRRS